MRDIHNSMKAVQSIKPAVLTSSANGAGVDLQGFDGAEVIFDCGTVDNTDTDETYTPKIQESDDNSTFTDVAAADQLGTLAAMVDDDTQQVGYIGTKRYIRPVITLAGTTPSWAGAALVIKGKPAAAPVL